jgi:exonuclease III
VFRQLACKATTPRILCGDFNSPMVETQSGELITFSQTRRANGSYAVVRGWERMDAAERALLEGLRPFDLHDAYRMLHGYQVDDSSWYAKNKGREFGFRLDHILASSSLIPVSVQYLHALRQNSLSDHAAVEAVFEYRG